MSRKYTMSDMARQARKASADARRTGEPFISIRIWKSNHEWARTEYGSVNAMILAVRKKSEKNLNSPLTK